MIRIVCPCAGCNKALKIGILMCLTHWRLLPGMCRYAVNRTWREYKKSGYGQNEYAAYISARNAAIEYVNAQLLKDAPIARDGVPA